MEHILTLHFRDDVKCVIQGRLHVALCVLLIRIVRTMVGFVTRNQNHAFYIMHLLLMDIKAIYKLIYFLKTLKICLATLSRNIA